jgi:hypothetical protein
LTLNCVDAARFTAEGRGAEMFSGWLAPVTASLPILTSKYGIQGEVCKRSGCRPFDPRGLVHFPAGPGAPRPSPPRRSSSPRVPRACVLVLCVCAAAAAPAVRRVAEGLEGQSTQRPSGPPASSWQRLWPLAPHQQRSVRQRSTCTNSPPATASTIATICRRVAAGRSGHACTTAARSGSTSPFSAPAAPDSAALFLRTPYFP